MPNPTETLQADLFEQVRQRIIGPGGFFFFAKFVCQFPDVDLRAHGPLCLLLEWHANTPSSPRRILVELPRKHLKTTLVTVAYPLWRFACMAIRGEPLNWRCAVVSSTKPNSQRFLRQISLIIKANPYVSAFIPELIPEFGNDEVFNTEEITLPGRSRAFGEPSVDTLGAGSKATSRHYDHIDEDDLINEENWDSPTAIAKAIDTHRLSTNLLESGTSTHFVCENAWANYDLNQHIIADEPSTLVFSVDAEEGLNYDRSRLLPPHVLSACKTWEDNESIWPARFPMAELAKIRQQVGARIYNAQYKNKPFDPEVVDFRESDLKRYNWPPAFGPDEDRCVGIRLDDGKYERISLASMSKVAAWDPALGAKGSPSRDGHGCLSAFTVLGTDPLNRHFILDVVADRKDPFDQLNTIFEKIIEWNISRIAIEDVLFQRLLFGVIDRALIHQRDLATRTGNPSHWSFKIGSGMFEPVKPLRGKDKDGRIRFYLNPPAKEGRLYASPQQLLLLDEWCHFPLAAHKDILDSLAYAVSIANRGERKEDRTLRLRQVDKDAETRDPVTGY